MKRIGLLLCIPAFWILLSGFYLLEPKIIGGEDETDPPPYLAFMLVEFSNGGLQQCGASYIADRVALTAAHCLYNSSNEKATSVRLAFNVPDGDLNNLTSEDLIDASWFDIFPEYDNSRFSSNPTRDAALIYLEEAPSGAQPISMANSALTNSLEQNRSDVVAYGWGLTENNGSPADVLQTVTLRMDNRQSYDSSSIWDLLEEWVVFAGSTDDGQDTCQGDSGGPLVYFDDGVPVLVGITSFGPQQCASDNQPGGYTRVSRVRSWAGDLDLGLFVLQDTVLSRRVNESSGAMSLLGLLLLAPGGIALRRRLRD
ncbi:MAG: serine protease [Natronospirillum sp.]|uniref:S1 family peptidase n=1 Tax=Natronospirillum sp. TaxID=2812955 RepID=UPI0025E26567|nr:serine protease [Natronospirillum sp.]MCH8550457.1 serine protease [Natronospirillum sp.]